MPKTRDIEWYRRLQLKAEPGSPRWKEQRLRKIRQAAERVMERKRLEMEEAVREIEME